MFWGKLKKWGIDHPAALVIFVLTLVGVLFTILQYLDTHNSLELQDSSSSTEVAILERMVTLGAGEARTDATATVRAQELEILESTLVALSETQTAIPLSIPTPLTSGPFREQQFTSIGSGIFDNVAISDGFAPYEESWLYANNHFNIQRLIREEHPSGCVYSSYNSEFIWVSSGGVTSVLLNGVEVGRIQTITQVLKHGVIATLPVNIGDEICVNPIPSRGFHIFWGPDIYYHYDSYCYRGLC